ncbi:MAG: hydrogenase maturation nickel metallochaperone HypA [Vicinamibacterales bacterium]
MHEASLMKNLMGKVEQLAREHGAGRVTRLEVKLGALSHFSPDHFREHFELAARGTVADGALLEIELLTDIADPRAQDVVLESADVEDA